MNTSRFIPFQCVSPILLENEDYREFPFIRGTGFFVKFPRYSDIFFVTARHCVVNNNSCAFGDIRVSVSASSGDREAVPFSCYLETGVESDREDVQIYVVDELAAEKRSVLTHRALALPNQELVESIFVQLIDRRENIRTVGFPRVSQGVYYDTGQAVFRPRGFHAKIIGRASIENWYEIGEKNWQENDLAGFSGSPILALLPNTEGAVTPIPIGVLITENNFLSINVVTDTIASFIKRSQKS